MYNWIDSIGARNNVTADHVMAPAAPGFNNHAIWNMMVDIMLLQQDIQIAEIAAATVIPNISFTFPFPPY